MKRILAVLFLLFASPSWAADVAQNAVADGSATVATSHYLNGYTGTTSQRYTIASILGLVTPTTLGLVIGTNVQAYNSNLTAINQALTNTSNPAFSTLNLVGSGLTVGTGSTNTGSIQFKNSTNNNIFTLQSGVSGAALSWTLPTAAPGGANYLLNVDADGTMGYTDPSGLGGGYTNLTSFEGQTAWRVFYSDTDGDVVELALGSDGTYLRSNGASSAPTWDTPSGAAHDAVTLSTDLGNNLLGLSTQQLTLDNQTNNYVFAGPATGGAGVPAFRALVAADVPTLNQNTTGTAANVSGTPALPNGTTATTQTAADNSTKLATTAYANALVSDTAYDATSWDAVTGIAASKNAVRDYLESKLPSGADGSYGIVLTNNSAKSPTGSTDEIYFEANILKANQNGTESTVAIGPLAGQVSFTGPTAARAFALPDAAATILTSNAAVTPAQGGTGVANGANNTLTFTGNYTLGLTLSNNTSVTLPASGTLAVLGANTFTGTQALGANNLTMTGSIAATGARVTKGWFTDVESTNMPTVGGTAILSSLTAPQFTTIELGAASDTTLARSAAGVVTIEGATVLTNTTMAVIDGSAAATLTAAQMSDPRCHVSNYGQTTADVRITLPAAAANLSCFFDVETAQSNHWGVLAGSGDAIRIIAADGTVGAFGTDAAAVIMTAAQAGQSFACWSTRTGASAYDWSCKAIAIGTSTFAAHAAF